MKKNLFILTILSIALFACKSDLQKRTEKIMAYIASAKVDSCHGDAWTTYYYCADTLITTHGTGYDVEVIHITSKNPAVESFSIKDTSQIKKMVSILKKKWGEPESFASVKLRELKRLAKQGIDSCRMEKKSDKGESYNQYFFCLKCYKIDLVIVPANKFHNEARISINVLDTVGDRVLHFDNELCWPEKNVEQKQELLDYLLQNCSCN